MNFESLLIDHPYYCHDNNYYSNNAACDWDTWQDFYDEYKDCDIDMNLIFRWDIRESDNKGYSMKVYIIHQRKGIFAPQRIHYVGEEDFATMRELLQEHYQKLLELWNPFSIKTLGKEEEDESV